MIPALLFTLAFWLALIWWLAPWMIGPTFVVGLIVVTFVTLFAGSAALIEGRAPRPPRRT